MPPKTGAVEPRKKDLREQAHEAINANIAEVIRQGCAALDRHADEVKKQARQIGLKGLDDLIESAADAIKRKSIQLAVGRKQPE